MHIPEWLVTQFDKKINNKSYECDLEDELNEILVDLEDNALLKSKNLAEY